MTKAACRASSSRKGLRATDATGQGGVRLLVLLACTVFGQAGLAYETDPYTKRHIDIADSTAVLDREVNAALDAVAGAWKGGENEWRFVNLVHRKLGGPWPVDRLERWAMRSDEVERLPVTRRESLYAQLPIRATRTARFWGFGRTIKVDGVLIGTDKIGHFFSQGRKFYRRYLRSGDERQAGRRAVMTERLLFGRMMTGIFSNADLVANYEGYRFYRGLFHDGVVGDRPALMAWRDGVPERVRDFTWADHVNAFWDEALNPNAYSRTFARHLARWLLGHCEVYRQHPDRFAVADADALFSHYAHIGLVDTSHLRPERFFPGHCDSVAEEAVGRGAAEARAAAGMSGVLVAHSEW